MEFLKEDISRIKEVMGIDEEPNSPMYKGPEGYDDGCDCYPDDDEIDDGEEIMMDVQAGLDEASGIYDGPLPSIWSSAFQGGTLDRCKERCASEFNQFQ